MRSLLWFYKQVLQSFADGWEEIKGHFLLFYMFYVSLNHILCLF